MIRGFERKHEKKLKQNAKKSGIFEKSHSFFIFPEQSPFYGTVNVV